MNRLLRLLKNFQLFLVVNMVRESPDLQAARIIEKVCESFLSVKPAILRHVFFDPEIEKAVNQMVPFPLNRQNSPAALDLKEIALTVLSHCQDRSEAGGEIPQEAHFPDEDVARETLAP